MKSEKDRRTLAKIFDFEMFNALLALGNAVIDHWLVKLHGGLQGGLAEETRGCNELGEIAKALREIGKRTRDQNQDEHFAIYRTADLFGAIKCFHNMHKHRAVEVSDAETKGAEGIIRTLLNQAPTCVLKSDEMTRRDMAGLLKSAMAESQEKNKESVETERYETKLREQEASIKRRDVKVEQLWTQMRAEKAAHEKAQAATSALKHELEEVRGDQRRATEELREKLRASEAARLKAEGECRDLRERMQRPVAHDKSHSRPALHGNDRCRHDQASEIFKLVNRLVRDVSDQETVA